MRTKPGPVNTLELSGNAKAASHVGGPRRACANPGH